MKNQYKISLIALLFVGAVIGASTISQTAFAQSQSVPSWIKDVGGYWCTNQIDNNEFLSAIQFLINKDVIRLNAVNMQGPSDNNVPEWVKNNTCWWSDNQITDIDFLSGIEFLVNKGTIRV